MSRQPSKRVTDRKYSFGPMTFWVEKGLACGHGVDLETGKCDCIHVYVGMAHGTHVHQSHVCVLRGEPAELDKRISWLTKGCRKEMENCRR